MARKRPKNPLDERYTFYDPHPGSVGAEANLPKVVKQVVDKLNGNTMTLRAALKRFRAATKGRGEFKICNYHIGFLLGDASGYRDYWRVISYRSPRRTNKRS